MNITLKKISLKMLLGLALVASMASTVHGMEISRNEGSGLSKEHIKKTYDVIDIIKTKAIKKTEDKIAMIKKLVFAGADVNMLLEKPVLAYALDTYNLELVKFLVEACDANINTQFRDPSFEPQEELRPSTHIMDCHFDQTGKLVDRYSKKKFMLTSIIEYMIHKLFYTLEYPCVTDDKARICEYLLNLSDINITDEIAHNILSDAEGNENYMVIKTILDKKPKYPRKLLALNNKCAPLTLISFYDWLEAAQDFLTIPTKKVGLDARLKGLLNRAYKSYTTDTTQSKNMLIKIMHAINAHTLMTSEEKTPLLNHAIFDAVNSNLKLSKENLELALQAAQGGNFKIAKLLLSQECDLNVKKSTLMKEIIDLGICAINKKKNNIVLDIFDTFALLESEKFALTKEALNKDNLDLGSILFANKVPHTILNIISKSPSLPKLENPTENELMLLDTIKNMKRYHDFEKLFIVKTQSLLRYSSNHIMKIHGNFFSTLSSQIWNISPRNQPLRILSGTDNDILVTLPKEDGDSKVTLYESKNTDVVGAGIASLIFQFVGADLKLGSLE